MDERDPGIISSIFVTDRVVYPVRTSSNLRQDKTSELGTPYFQLILNNNIEEFKNIILERLLDDNQLFGDTLVINKGILDDNEMMEKIREKAIKQGKPTLVRISDEGYTLTREDYEKLSFASFVAADICEENLLKENNILLQNGAFKLGIQHDAQPVLERRKTFDELISRNVFHVNHPLSDLEFKYLIDCINNVDNVSIELDYFNPDYYEEFLRKLQDYHVKENINIQLIGYLLEDKLSTFERLEAFPYEIDVVYSTCHDMVEMYTQEPYTENRMYYSQVEGGGKTSLGNYLNVLEELSNFEAMAKSGNYSPLEIAILAKIKIDSDYIYDPDHADSNTDYWDNVNLSQMIHHEESGKKRAICVGFATLYSAYCRRCGIPMFRYSTRGHMRTIGRIQDEKYGVDTIGTADITWDLPDQNLSTHSYKYFMGSPRDFVHYQNASGIHEFLTIADVFSIPLEEFDKVVMDSKDPVESFYTQFSYNPMGYAGRLLELMSVAPEAEYFDIYDVIYGLCEKGCFEGIPEETLLKAITNVLHSLHWSEEAITTYIQEVRDNHKLRQFALGHEPAIGTTDGQKNIPVNLITPENIQEYRDILMQYPNRPMFIHTGITSENTQKTEIIPISPQPTLEPDNEIIPTVPQPTIETDNLDYVHQVIQYCATNNISVYSYFHNIGNIYHGESNLQMPAFEKENPFLKDSDKALVSESNENQIVHYFANTMMRVIRLNLTQEESKQFERLFTKEDEDYVNAIIDEMNERIEEKKELGKESKSDNMSQEEINHEDHMDDYSEDYIPGTNIHKPRGRGIYETDEEYVEFLREFYHKHFPNADIGLNQSNSKKEELQHMLSDGIENDTMTNEEQYHR